jgi:uncharacterized protein YpmS
MRKWIKSLMLLVALLLVTILAVVYGSFRLFKGAPDWYHRSAVSLAQRELLARQAFNKFADIQNAAALARRDEIAGASASSSSTPTPIVVSFSDDELNAFFEKWANYANWKSNYDRYVQDPLIILEDGHLILAGQVLDLDAVVSLQLNPRIDADGRLDLRLDRVLAGRLPLPRFFIGPYKDRLTASLRRNLPRWQHFAAIDSDGTANSALISASMARLFIHTLDHTSADPILFLPLVQSHANVPVRVSDVKLEDHNLTMTVLPLSAGEREALVKRVQADEPPASSD